jgi:hypothetical protein
MDMIKTPQELAPILHCSAQGIRNGIARGDIAAEKIAGKWLINATRQWPALFGADEGADADDAASAASMNAESRR